MNLSGRVKDSTGAAITGANVYSSDANGKPDSTGLAVSGGTGDDGTFTLQVPDRPGYLAISYLGMKPTIVPYAVAQDTKGIVNEFTLDTTDSTTFKDVTITATRKPKPTPWYIYAAVGLALLAAAGAGYWYYKKRRK